MIKLIVSDLDGTLLNDKKQLTPQTAAAIQSLQQKGIRFLLNTEREFLEAKRILETADIYCDMICSGGACFFSQEGIAHAASPISQDKIAPMLRIFGKHCVFYEIYSTKAPCILGSKRGYRNYLSKEVIPACADEEAPFPKDENEIEYLINETLFYDSGTRLLQENPKILKISSVCTDSEKLSLIQEEIQHTIPELAVSRDCDYRLEVSAIESLKGAALMEYLKKTGISLNDTLVIGDGEHDYSMLGLPYVYSVAMGNSIPVIKEISRYKTKTNNEEGAALVFRQVLRDAALSE
jgi:Cof subfamily protein (haloacid dehalogenase superfamily)